MAKKAIRRECIAQVSRLIQATVSGSRLLKRVQKLLQRFGKLAGITKPVHPHLLRHSFATEAVRNSAKIHGLQRQALGHASIATTGVYLHADEEELEPVVGVLPSVSGR